MSVHIEVVEHPARACAAMLVGAAAGGGHIALSGGSTPKAAYESFVEAVRAVGIDVSHSTMWFGDERCVPPEDDRSNYKLARAALLLPLGDVRPTVHRMQGELGPAAGAEAYERELEQAGPPHFDLLLLGLGPDGHLASLFPDQESLSERSRWAIGVERAGHEPFVSRISMTLRALTWARRVVFLVSGQSKANAVAAAFAPDATPNPHVPASLLPPMVDELTVLLDGAAASGLPSGAGR